jgi:uncharacterized membrane protein
VNYAHLHLLFNHFPILGTMIGFALFLASFWEKSEDLRRSSLIIFAAMALLTIPTFLTGRGTELMIADQPGVSDVLIQRHEGSAMLAILFMECTGSLALLGLWQAHRSSRPARWNIAAILLFSSLTVGLMARTGNTGGDIRHPEIRDNQGTTVPEGTVGSIISRFEPSPKIFTDTMPSSNGWWFWWWILMALHFVGLTLLIGTVGILDIRIMGFLKQLPVAPLHQFIPWAMAGLGVNIVTGMVAFTVQPDSYIYSSAFWLKILSLLLLGLNAGAFYLTGVFEGVQQLGPGQDATISAKLVAASSLLLWLLVVAFGRYIQPTAGTISPY